MLDGEDADLIAVALQHVALSHLDELERVGELADNAGERAEEVAQPGRPVDGERDVAHPQRERLEHPRQAEVVVGVEVGDEDLLEVDEPDRGAQELALRALAAVEEQPVAAAPDEQRGGAAPCRRRARGGAEEDDVEVHAPMVTIVAPDGALRQDEPLAGRDPVPRGGCACSICQIASRTSPP